MAVERREDDAPRQVNQRDAVRPAKRWYAQAATKTFRSVVFPFLLSRCCGYTFATAASSCVNSSLLFIAVFGSIPLRTFLATFNGMSPFLMLFTYLASASDCASSSLPV